MSPIKIKSVSSPDVDVGRWAPPASDEIHFLLELEIGPREKAGGDLFQVEVATPETLLRLSTSRSQNVLIDRAFIILREFSWADLMAHLEATVERCSAESWSMSCAKLQRYFHWEYEDYVSEKQV